MAKFDVVEFISKLVRFKSISTLPEMRGEVRACAVFLRDFFASKGFDSILHETPLHPVVFASRKCASGNPRVRILCYGHYDVQPVDPLDKWISQPFEPNVRDGKIFARGAADNKGPTACVIAGFLNFIDKNPDAPIDIAFMLEGEEEIGSVHMRDFIERNRDMLSAYDYVVLSDTSSASLDDVIVTVGLRGTGSLEFRFKGPNCDVHSGMYGGIVYNPIQAMAEVCASLHNSDGLVNIQGFYDGILSMSDREKSDTATAPFGEESIKKQLGLDELYRQSDIPPMEAGRAYPTLEFVGIGGGYQGAGSKSVIPSECFCKISCRSAPGQDTRHLLDLVEKAVKERCPKQVKVSCNREKSSCGEAYFVDPRGIKGGSSIKARRLSEAFGALEKCVSKIYGRKPLYLREGASIPLMSDIHRLTGLDCVMLGLFLPQDNIHAPNEGFSIESIKRGCAYYEEFFSTVSR